MIFKNQENREEIFRKTIQMIHMRETDKPHIYITYF